MVRASPGSSGRGSTARRSQHPLPFVKCFSCRQIRFWWERNWNRWGSQVLMVITTNANSKPSLHARAGRWACAGEFPWIDRLSQHYH